jgi:hypothetical protein
VNEAGRRGFEPHCPLQILSVPFGDGGNPSPLGEENLYTVAMRRCQLGAHTKVILKFS